jgi:hypothetical protein
MNTSLRWFAFAALGALLSACASQPAPPPQSLSASLGLPEPLPPPAMAPAAVAPADAFLARLASHCGQAFLGRVRVDTPASPDSPFAGQTVVMHVRDCSAQAVSVPLHVGQDRSRTWRLTRTAEGLRLKHDHRHADGSPDAVTLYGGDAVGGRADRQDFPVDAESIALFRREGLTASVSNTWAMFFEPDDTFVYELSRPGGRFFQVAFDLRQPVALPPPAWGSAPP